MLKAGIIDTGVNLSELNIPGSRFSGVNLCQPSSQDLSDRLDHGTICTAIIASYPVDIHFFVVKILDTVPLADEQLLIQGIRHCLDAGVDIINISLGIASPAASDGLIQICDEAYTRNVPIIAAAHNDSKICFPAWYAKVFGVGHLARDCETSLVTIDRSPVEFFINGDFIFRQKHHTGSSFSCPKLTGEALLVLDRLGPLTVEQLRATLFARSTKAELPLPFARNDYGYEHMTFFDRSETASLANKYLNTANDQNQRILILPLNDPILDQLSGIDLTALNPSSQFIRGQHSYDAEHRPVLIPDKKTWQQFDTLAIGPIPQLLSLYNRKAVYRQLQDLLEEGKNIWTFDPVSLNILQSIRQKRECSSKLRYPSLNQNILDDFRRFRYLPTLKTPVIAVIASGKNEALSSQIHILKLLQDSGLDTAYVSPAAQGMLTGACYCVPISDTQTFFAGEEELYLFLQHLTKAIQAFLIPDIILTGIPGSLLPRPVLSGPLNAFSGALQFLYGMQPDSLIMAVCGDDLYENGIENLRIARSFTRATPLCFLFSNKQDQALHPDWIEKLTAIAPVLRRETPDLGSQMCSLIQERFSRKQPS